MKKLILITAVLFLLVGCNKTPAPTEIEREYNNLYTSINTEMREHFDKLGEWEYSPDGKDSLWNKTHTVYDIKLLKVFIKASEITERKWDSLYFLSKKYDSIPFPHKSTLGLHETQISLKNSIKNWKETIER